MREFAFWIMVLLICGGIAVSFLYGCMALATAVDQEHSE